MRGMLRPALASLTVAMLAVGSGVAAQAGSGGGGGGGGGGGNMVITIAPRATLSAGGNAVTLSLTYTCDANPADPTPAFSGGVGAQVWQIVKQRQVAFGGGFTNISTANCDGSVNSATVVVNPNLFGPSASPPFKNGQAIAQASGNLCDWNQLDASGNPTFCDFGGSSPTSILIGP